MIMMVRGDLFVVVVFGATACCQAEPPPLTKGARHHRHSLATGQPAFSSLAKLNGMMNHGIRRPLAHTNRPAGERENEDERERNPTRLADVRPFERRLAPSANTVPGYGLIHHLTHGGGSPSAAAAHQICSH